MKRLIAVCAAAALGLGLLAAPAAAATAAPTDWSKGVVDSTMARKTPDTLGGWGYTEGLYLYGQYLVYQRTHDARYLTYIKSWADRFVGSDGSIGFGFNNLDQMQAGNVLVLLYTETHQAKYSKAAKKIRDRLRTYPRTADGGFFHATSKTGQLWADGVFMSVPFLIRYGHTFGEAAWADDEATQQLLVYANHLQQSSGLLRHAYDETKASSWADRTTGVSAQVWCRAEGWWGMAAIDTLELLPADHPKRAALIAALGREIAGYARYQDPATGRWFQVVDRADVAGNWTETSCSSMYTFTISRAVQRGYVPASYAPVAAKGYQGVLARVSQGSDGRTNVAEICVGTNVGDLTFYLDRPRATNDLHGLGSFLIMNEQLRG